MRSSLAEFQANILSAEQDYDALFQQTLDLLAKQMVEQRILERLHQIPSAYVAAKIKEWAVENFQGMLVAKSIEELKLFVDGSTLLIGRVREVLALPLTEVNPKVVECLRYITELVVTSQAGFAREHPDLFESCYFRLVNMIVDCPEAQHGSLRNIAQQLFDLMNEDKPSIFHRKQLELVEALNKHPEYIHPDHAKLAQILQLLTTQIQGVAQMRRSYLESLVDYRQYSMGFSWIIIGLCLMTATIFLSLGLLPGIAAAIGITATGAMVGPAIVLGAAVFGYSIFDFVREAMHRFKKRLSPRQPTSRLKSHIASVLQLSGCLAGIAFASVGLIAAIPTFGMSLWIPVVMAGLSLSITTGFGVSLFYQYFSSKRSLKNVEGACIEYNTQKLHEIDQIIQQESISTLSTALIDKELAGFSADEKIDEKTLQDLQSSLRVSTESEHKTSRSTDAISRLHEQTEDALQKHNPATLQASNDEQMSFDDDEGESHRGPPT